MWSTDWFDDPDGQTERLCRDLEMLRELAADKLTEENERRAATGARGAKPLPVTTDAQQTDAGSESMSHSDSPPTQDGTSELPQPPVQFESTPGNTALPESLGGIGEFLNRQQDADQLGNPSNPSASNAVSLDAPVISVPNGPNNGLSHAADTYAVADLLGDGFEPKPDRFYEATYFPILREMVNRVVELEGPIYQDIVVTRIARAHEFMRNGVQIVDRVDRAIASDFKRSNEGDRIVVWPRNLMPGAVIPYRGGVPTQRELLDVPIIEVAGIARLLLNQGLSRDDVVQELKVKFGLGKLRDTMRKRFEAAAELAAQSERSATSAEFPLAGIEDAPSAT